MYPASIASEPRDHQLDEPRSDVRMVAHEGAAPDTGRAGRRRSSALVKLATTAFYRFRPVRVLHNYNLNRGPLLAAGLSFHSIFAAFAALWLGFSIGGLVLKAQPTLSDAVFEFINSAVPGLIDTGDGSGIIKANALLAVPVLSWTGAVASIGLLLTALGWLAASRAAIRTIFGLAGRRTNPLILRLQDVGLAFAFGLAVLVSAGLTLVGTRALGIFGAYFHWSATDLAARVVGLTVMYLFDAAALASLFRVLAGIPIPTRRLLGGVMMGATGLAVLKMLGSRLLTASGSNPLLASFTAIIGLMIWFNLISQVILMSASWIAVGASDEGWRVAGGAKDRAEQVADAT